MIDFPQSPVHNPCMNCGPRSSRVAFPPDGTQRARLSPAYSQPVSIAAGLSTPVPGPPALLFNSFNSPYYLHHPFYKILITISTYCRLNPPTEEPR
jgi:hypothetical protein